MEAEVNDVAGGNEMMTEGGWNRKRDLTRRDAIACCSGTGSGRNDEQPEGRPGRRGERI